MIPCDLQEQYFAAVQAGTKTWEMRRSHELVGNTYVPTKWDVAAVGMMLSFNGAATYTILDIARGGLDEMIFKIGPENLTPGKSHEECRAIYLEFYGAGDIFIAMRLR